MYHPGLPVAGLCHQGLPTELRLRDVVREQVLARLDSRAALPDAIDGGPHALCPVELHRMCIVRGACLRCSGLHHLGLHSAGLREQELRRRGLRRLWLLEAAFDALRRLRSRHV